MKNTIKKKNARRTAYILRDRVFITVNYTDITGRYVWLYPVVGYDTNGTTVTRFTVYADKLLSCDTIAAYIIETLHYKVLRHIDTFNIDSHMIIKDRVTNKPEFCHNTVNPRVYKYDQYSVNELSLISW